MLESWWWKVTEIVECRRPSFPMLDWCSWRELQNHCSTIKQTVLLAPRVSVLMQSGWQPWEQCSYRKHMQPDKHNLMKNTQSSVTKCAANTDKTNKKNALCIEEIDRNRKQCTRVASMVINLANTKAKDCIFLFDWSHCFLKCAPYWILVFSLMALNFSCAKEG